MYHIKLLRLLSEIKHFEVEAQNEYDVMGMTGRPGLGIYFTFKAVIGQNEVKNIYFSTINCPIMLTIGEAICRMAEGKTYQEISCIKEQDVRDRLGDVPFGKERNIRQALEALNQIIP